MPTTPLANREIPATAVRGTLTMTDYLRPQLPTLEGMKSGLAVFAIFVIVRSLLRRVCDLVRKGNRRGHLHGRAAPAARVTPDLQPARAWSIDQGLLTMKSNGNIASLRHDVPDAAKSWTTPRDARAQDFANRRLISRAPPAPPLTPPELSSTVFNISPTRSHALDDFMHQPNPDYTTSAASAVSPLDSASAPAPRRRSYHRTMPIGIPTPQRSFKTDTVPASFSATSYPPASPLLPPPPLIDASKGTQRDEVDVEGEIISALGHDGAGWTRHTRVYGGSVCLACAAAAGSAHEGGFYGATVTPEEMRRDYLSQGRSSKMPVLS